MKIDSPDKWPWTAWPGCIELLRAFTLDDEAQAKYFPAFESPRPFDLLDGAMLAGDALRPSLAQARNWAYALFLGSDGAGREAEQEMLLQLSDAFGEVANVTLEADDESSVARTSPKYFAEHQEPLRQLAREALQVLGEETRPPQMKWDEIIVP